MFGKKTYRKILILGSKVDGIVKAQFDPFKYSKAYLKNEFDIKFEFRPMAHSKELAGMEVADDYVAIFLIPFWRETLSDLRSAIIELKSKHPQKKVIFVDPYAQPTSNYLPLLDVVDHFVKRQTYSDPSDHLKEYKGGVSFTHYLATEDGFDLGDSFHGSDIPSGMEAHIQPGWSLGTAKRFYKLAKNQTPRFKKKNIDVFCRMALGNRSHIDWYSEYRRISIERMTSLKSQYTCAISGCYNDEGLVPQSQYFKEIKQSKIVISPFGWGESCWRDYEAVCYGGLLVKPDMSHIATEPNIFVDGETYIAVKWDLSDLHEKCEYYLENEDARLKIVRNAYDVYHRYFSEHKLF